MGLKVYKTNPIYFKRIKIVSIMHLKPENTLFSKKRHAHLFKGKLENIIVKYVFGNPETSQFLSQNVWSSNIYDLNSVQL